MGFGFIGWKKVCGDLRPMKQRGQYRLEEAKVNTENVAATPEFTAAAVEVRRMLSSISDCR